MSTHAEAAKAIRKELKNTFPLVKFRVLSTSYSGGSSVRAIWCNGPTTQEVNSLISKYQYGHFNGMEDIYENTNSRDDLPQVKFVFSERIVDEEIQQEVFELLQKTHAHFDEVSSMDETNDNLMSSWSVWTARNYIYRVLVKLDLTHGLKEHIS